MYQLDDFILKFKLHCQQKFPLKSGTATSYSNAIKYLFRFMNATEVNKDLILEIKSLEPDIRDATSLLYKDLNNFFTSNGQSSYLEKGFLKAALPVFFEFSNNVITMQGSNEAVLLSEIRDNQVIADFYPERLRHELPTAEYVVHNYNVRRISGTANESATKIRIGRKAEKYFISFLISLGFKNEIDFIDVANNKNYGYDIRFLGVELEIKNIKSGSFFITDNEIARLENSKTNLILVDIDNGIWLLKNDSIWLKNSINNIKNLRDYCKSQYNNLDVCDVRIMIDDNLKQSIPDISSYNKEQVTKSILEI